MHGWLSSTAHAVQHEAGTGVLEGGCGQHASRAPTCATHVHVQKARSGAAAAAAADDDEDDDGRIGAGILVLASVAIVGGFVVAPIHCLAQIIPSGF